ncbi:MAG: sensor histidine kinase, partial [Geminicoccaceae bacterium]|nr:sensor histidine kinase [Geminicoccaceae bacterium]
SGVSVVVGSAGRPWGVIAAFTRERRKFTAYDVSFLQSVANVLAATLQRDAWSRHQRLLLDELSHRVKNSLATVQAIASLTFRHQPASPDVVQSFIARLHALAQAQDLHFRSEGKDIDLRQLIHQQIEPYDTAGGRISIRGRSGIRLPPSIAIDLAMAIHELVTNAIKHGALVADRGTLEVDWQLEHRTSDDLVVVDWRERSSVRPDVDPSEGVGSKLLRAIARRPGLDLERRFEEDGLHCRIGIVLDRNGRGRDSGLR